MTRTRWWQRTDDADYLNWRGAVAVAAVISLGLCLWWFARGELDGTGVIACTIIGTIFTAPIIMLKEWARRSRRQDSARNRAP